MGTTALPTLPHSTTTHPKSNHGLYLCYLDHRVDYQHLERRCELRFGDDPGQVRESKKEGNKEIAKGNTNASIGDRISAGVDAIGNKADESKHDSKAEAYKTSAQH